MEIVNILKIINEGCIETLNLVHLISIDMGEFIEDEKQLNHSSIEDFINEKSQHIKKYKFNRIVRNNVELAKIDISKMSEDLIEIICDYLEKKEFSMAIKTIIETNFLRYNLYLEYKIFNEDLNFIRAIGLLNSICGSIETKNVISAVVPNENKLKWSGTPAQFGYIINELVEKGFIECPTTHSSPSISKLAKVCFEIFDLSSTPQNIEKELNPEKNTLSVIKRKYFNIPNVSELK